MRIRKLAPTHLRSTQTDENGLVPGPTCKGRSLFQREIYMLTYVHINLRCPTYISTTFLMLILVWD